MPEGPEVKIIGDNISMLSLGKRLLSVEVINDGFLKKTKNLDQVPVGRKVIRVETKGKFCYMLLDDRTAIGMTFGMTGNIRVEPTEEYLKLRGETHEKYMRHCKVRFTLDDPDQDRQNGSKTVFYFNCVRNFAWIWYLSDKELGSKLSAIGPSILAETEDKLDSKMLVTRWRRFNHKTICEALMEQKLVSGIGNYIKCEILYRKGMHPLAKVSDLTDEQLYALYLEACTIAADAYHDGGASLYTYTGLHGDKSEFKLKLQVYDRHEDPEGNRVKKMDTPDKRSTYWVPELQTQGMPDIPHVQTKKRVKVKAKAKVRSVRPVRPDRPVIRVRIKND